DRREALALVAAGEDDRILARRELELRVADGDGVAAPRELGHFAGREQAHLLGLQERNDFPVAERRSDLHRRSLPHRVSLIIAAVSASTLAVKSAASHGVVAQLGERRVRNAKVGSSILLHSTTYPQETPRRLGAIGAQVPLRPQSVGAVQMIVS